MAFYDIFLMIVYKLILWNYGEKIIELVKRFSRNFENY